MVDNLWISMAIHCHSLRPSRVAMSPSLKHFPATFPSTDAYHLPIDSVGTSFSEFFNKADKGMRKIGFRSYSNGRNNSLLSDSPVLT
jgi:hypothetical protein